MKNEYSRDRSSYFSGPRLHANVFAWNKPASKSETHKQGTENILRWEDDGGLVSETVAPLPQVAENNTPRLMDVGSEVHI